MCATGHAGADCSVNVSGVLSLVAGHAHTESHVGHSLVGGCDAPMLLYMFGGYSLQRGLLNHLWSYNVSSGHWRLLEPVNKYQPSPRSVS